MQQTSNSWQRHDVTGWRHVTPGGACGYDVDVNVVSSTCNQERRTAQHTAYTRRPGRPGPVGVLACAVTCLLATHTKYTPSARLWVTQIQRLVASPLTGLGINWFIIVSHRSAQRALTDWPTLCLQCQLRRTWQTSERSFSAAAVKIHTNDFKSSFSVALLTTVSLSNLGVLASEGWWEPWRPQSGSRSLQWSEIEMEDPEETLAVHCFCVSDRVCSSSALLESSWGKQVRGTWVTILSCLFLVFSGIVCCRLVFY